MPGTNPNSVNPDLANYQVDGFDSSYSTLDGVADGIFSAAEAIPIVGDIIGGINRERRAHQQQFEEFKMQNYLLDKQNAFSREMYEEYQTPEARMKHMQAAGISPSSAAQGISGASPAASPSSSSAPSVPSLNTDYMLSRSAADKIAAESALLDSQKEGQDISNQWSPVLNDAAVRKIDSEIDRAVSEKELNDEQARQIRELLPTLKSIKLYELENLKKQLDIEFEEINKIRQEIKTLKSSEALNYSQSSLNKQLESESAAREGLVSEEIETEKAKALQASADALISECKSILASHGIYTDSSIWTNLLTSVDNGPYIIDRALSFGIDAIRGVGQISHEGLKEGYRHGVSSELQKIGLKENNPMLKFLMSYFD